MKCFVCDEVRGLCFAVVCFNGAPCSPLVFIDFVQSENTVSLSSQLSGFINTTVPEKAI